MASSVDKGHGAAYSGVQTVFAQHVIGSFGSPWLKAGAREKAEALAIVGVYLDQERASAETLAGMFGVPRHRVYAARWLAVASGLITRMGDQVYRVTYDGKRLCERGAE